MKYKYPPMPCGFVRAGVPIRIRQEHYNACPHPACQYKAWFFRQLHEANHRIHNPQKS